MSTLQLSEVTTLPSAREWCGVVADSRAHNAVGLPVDTPEELLAAVGAGALDERTDAWLLREHGQVVAAAQVDSPLLDNTDLAALEVHVRPAHRRRGLGRVLCERLLTRLREDGRSRALAELTVPLAPPDPGAFACVAFARALGAEPQLAQLRWVLELPAAPGPLRALAGRTDPHYALVQWVDRAPPEWVAPAAALKARMSTDAPMGGLALAPESWDETRYRDTERRAAARGRTRLVSAVHDRRSGRLVAYTDIAVSRRRPELAYQWDTVVAPDHRGRRLGIWVKAANLTLLAQRVPGVRQVTTWNAASNTFMIGVNDELGFRAVERGWEYELRLAPRVA